jgi:RNA polymerase sigma factor (sigma-70 family)
LRNGFEGLSGSECFYRLRTMKISEREFPPTNDPRLLDSLTLVTVCAANPAHHALWSEFLRRFGGQIKLFIRGTLQRSVGDAAFYRESKALSGVTVADLFQDTVMRLVENNCIALKRFSGTTEEQLSAYFAVVARSVVRDYLRRQRALKRPRWQSMVESEALGEGETRDVSGFRSYPSPDRTILARELGEISVQTIANQSGANANRDRLMFRLYFYEGLTHEQISACKGIELTKAGVEKALNRVVDKMRSAAGANPAEELQG